MGGSGAADISAASGTAAGGAADEAPASAADIAPVCIGVGGRAGIGRTSLVDVIVAGMSGCGPLTVGELPACNDPRLGEIAEDGAPPDPPDPPEPPGRPAPPVRPGVGPAAVPVDIAVHMVLGAPAPADRRAIDAQARRGVPVLVVRGRCDEAPGAGARGRDCWEHRDHEAPDADGGGLAVALPPGARPRGTQALIECLSAGAARILAARADAVLDAWRARALEGPDREHAERLLASSRARELRAVGRRGWPRAGTRDEAAAEAARWRAEANGDADPAARGRALAWHLRYVDAALEHGAAVQEAVVPGAAVQGVEHA